MPAVNNLANLLTGWRHTDAGVQHCDETVYPAAVRCRREAAAPHAKWHEMSANGLLDLMFLADDMYALTSTGKARAAAEADARSFVGFAVSTINGWEASVGDLLEL